MIYSVSGKIGFKGDNYVVLEVGGLGLKITANSRVIKNLGEVGNEAKLFSSLYIRENSFELYGFISPDELNFFELLNSVAGVGPKSALAILDITDLDKLKAAIKEGRHDLLTRASGIGRKTAERIILELKNKVEAEKSELAVKKMEVDSDLIETLVDLGYRREQVKAALEKVSPEISSLEARLKATLKILGGKF